MIYLWGYVSIELISRPINAWLTHMWVTILEKDVLMLCKGECVVHTSLSCTHRLLIGQQNCHFRATGGQGISGQWRKLCFLKKMSRKSAFCISYIVSRSFSLDLLVYYLLQVTVCRAAMRSRCLTVRRFITSQTWYLGLICHAESFCHKEPSPKSKTYCSKLALLQLRRQICDSYLSLISFLSEMFLVFFSKNSLGEIGETQWLEGVTTCYF